MFLLGVGYARLPLFHLLLRSFSYCYAYNQNGNRYLIVRATDDR